MGKRQMFTESGNGGITRDLQEYREFFEAMLRCEDPTCGLLLPLVLKVNRSTTDKVYSKYRAAWKFDRLTCLRGDPNLGPINW